MSPMTITAGTRRISMPDLGPESPLPMVGPLLESPYRIEGALPSEIIEGAGYGAIPNLAPHREQDGYDRNRTQRDVPTIVLENDHLRAVFLPELGGRLWELFDKHTGKQLLHTPDTLQFANLGLRNAWFAGGVEWNTTTRGHSPSTCTPVHAAVVPTSAGREILRMWEFDRVRGTVFQLDVWLPDERAVLLVAVRLRNPADEDVPVYWWANAAVPQHRANRVLAPADTAFASDEAGGISRVFPTSDGGVDCTWPTHNRHARDFFFDLAPQQRRWILQSDAEGDGLAIISTDRLRGRKLFVWGQEPGGHRWQRWLTPEDEQIDGRTDGDTNRRGETSEYSEIQAGLAQTQFEHLRLPAHDEWRWVEAYGNASLDASAAASEDWDEAIAHAADRIEHVLPADELAGAAVEAASWRDLPPSRFLANGTGWGALESALRQRTGAPWIVEDGTPFRQETLGEDQLPWHELLTDGTFPGAGSFVTGDAWFERLAAHRETPETLSHLGTIKHAAGDLRGARNRYMNAIAFAEDGHASARAIAHRGLALLDLDAGATDDALAHYTAACAARPEWRAVLVEAATAALDAERDEVALGLIDRFDNGRHTQTSGGSADGRIALLHARALAGTGRTDKAISAIRSGIDIADLREGDNALADLWRRLLPGEPVPTDAQFSMTGEQ